MNNNVYSSSRGCYNREERNRYFEQKINTKQETRLQMAIVVLTFIPLVFICSLLVYGLNSNSDLPTELTHEQDSTTLPIVETITTAESTSFMVTTEKTTENTTEPSPEYISLGKFKLTAYCPCVKCCGKYGENRPTDENGNIIVYTASGKIAKQGYTVAADISKLPFGTKIYINNNEYQVQDKGSAVKGNTIDIYFNDHNDAINFGTQYQEVFIIRK